MIYELTLNAVKRKLYDFDHIPRFINAFEIACALGIGYGQAGLALPKPPLGMDIMDMLKEYAPPVMESNLVQDQVKQALGSYFKQGEQITEDTLMTLRLGYGAGLP